MNLPKEEYIRVEENGHTITYCTLRQKVLHTIGLNSGHVGRRLYTINRFVTISMVMMQIWMV